MSNQDDADKVFAEVKTSKTNGKPAILDLLNRVSAIIEKANAVKQKEFKERAERLIAEAAERMGKK